MNAPLVSPNPDMTTLISIFEVALNNAEPSFLKSRSESLHSIARFCYDAFNAAKDRMITENLFPVVIGNEPHCLTPSERSDLSSAIGNVYGFDVSSAHHIVNPHSIETLRALQAIPSEMHKKGYIIFT